MSKNRTSAALPPLSTTPLTPETLKLLLDIFDHAMSHTHYAVSGHAALMVWGYRSNNNNHNRNKTKHPPFSHVSIVCPAADKQVILAWAKAAGWHVYAPSSSPGQGGDHADVIGVPVPGEGAGELVVWPFRLRAVGDPAAWENLDVVRPCEMETPYVGWAGEAMRTGARVLAVPTLLDEFGRAWYFCVVKGEGRSDGGGDERERHVAELMLWILRRLAADVEKNGVSARWKLMPDKVLCLLYDKFWDAFVHRYPDALSLFQQCGLPGPMRPARVEVATAFTATTTKTASDEFATGLYMVPPYGQGRGGSRIDDMLDHPHPTTPGESHTWI
ncbi:hypothetical protein N657DRAFT_676791 [Parathielavia appendiculata]|uniref:Uncharacterized protein n=1 Tax=Parathielavia appendiculata TaxID=2587402 RepID=A0AAN6UCM6_9PEZI|nr:hypothetical protein N657DRAFT_676791 [Parathielavia appendiculata]